MYNGIVVLYMLRHIGFSIVKHCTVLRCYLYCMCFTNPPITVREPVSSPVQEPVPSPVREPVSSPVQEPVPSLVREPVPSPVQGPVPNQHRDTSNRRFKCVCL